MKFVICRAQKEDILAAQKIGLTNWTTIHEGYKNSLGEELHEAFFKNWKKLKEQAVYEMLSSENGFVVKDKDRVVGYGGYSIDEEN